MTLKQTLFVEAYLGDALGNATEAARLAGYKDAKNEGHRLMSHPEVVAAVSRRVEKVAMSADEVLERLSDHARGDLRPFLVESGGALFPDLTTQSAKANIHLIKKAKFKRRTTGSGEDKETETEVEIELHDPQAALVHLGRHHRLFIDKVEQINSGTIKVEVEYVDSSGSTEETS